MLYATITFGMSITCFTIRSIQIYTADDYSFKKDWVHLAVCGGNIYIGLALLGGAVTMGCVTKDVVFSNQTKIDRLIWQKKEDSLDDEGYSDDEGKEAKYHHQRKPLKDKMANAKEMLGKDVRLWLLPCRFDEDRDEFGESDLVELV